MSLLEAVDWFLNASAGYRRKEPTRREELLALVQRELDACQIDAEREALEKRKALLKRP